MILSKRSNRIFNKGERLTRSPLFLYLYMI
nr:MAG TPA: hypothetical protein [Caudoviricetes sp.]